MRVLVQRVRDASVKVEEETVGSCFNGLLVFVGFTEGDSLKEIEWMAKKIVHLRIFPDSNGVMNESVLDIQGSVLSVSQFTLYADAQNGNRPSYKKALKSEEARDFYELFNKELQKYVTVSTGEFGSHMEVSLTNIGPTTIWLEK